MARNNSRRCGAGNHGGAPGSHDGHSSIRDGHDVAPYDHAGDNPACRDRSDYCDVPHGPDDRIGVSSNEADHRRCDGTERAARQTLLAPALATPGQQRPV